MARYPVDRLAPRTAFVAAERTSASPHAAISGKIDMRILELLTARLCHELSGPIAAVNNGVELLSEEDPNFAADAIALIGESARRAGNRLQFYRFAYGFGQAGAIVGRRPHELAISFFDASNIACDYAERVRALAPDWQKLACNLLAAAAETLPRGGRLVLTSRPLNVEAVGEAAALSPDAGTALSLATPVAELTARTVQAYFTGLLADALDCRLVGTAEPGRVRLTALAAGA